MVENIYNFDYSLNLEEKEIPVLNPLKYKLIPMLKLFPGSYGFYETIPSLIKPGCTFKQTFKNFSTVYRNNTKQVQTFYGWRFARKEGG